MGWVCIYDKGKKLDNNQGLFERQLASLAQIFKFLQHCSFKLIPSLIFSHIFVLDAMILEGTTSFMNFGMICKVINVCPKTWSYEFIHNYVMRDMGTLIIQLGLSCHLFFYLLI